MLREISARRLEWQSTAVFNQEFSTGLSLVNDELYSKQSSPRYPTDLKIP